MGITASGTMPYVTSGLSQCRAHNITTACITCNKNSPLEKEVNFSILAPVGPEFVTGSTRMKAGTAQKLILNMISTTVMIKLGRVKGNKMVDMHLSNNKLTDRGTRMLMDELSITLNETEKLLKEYGSVRKAMTLYKKQIGKSR